MAKKFKYLGSVLMLSTLVAIQLSTHAGAATPRFEVFEAELTSAATYANPFLEVTVTAEVTAPSGRELVKQLDPHRPVTVHPVISSSTRGVSPRDPVDPPWRTGGFFAKAGSVRCSP